MTEDVARFAQDYIDAQKAAWERKDFSGLVALEHPAVVFQNINGTVFDGRDAHLRAIEGMQDGFNGASITQDWQYLLGSGDVFSLAYTWTIHSAPQPLQIAGILVGRITDHKLVEEWGANYPVAVEDGG
jgi:ketosteroid isomerase-like protein